jgi:AraC-like DNA-binding protein
MNAHSGLDVRFFAAPSALADCITTIYRIELDPPMGEPVSDLLLPEWCNLRFVSPASKGTVVLGNHEVVAGGFVATGPTSKAQALSAGPVRLWGVGLFPLGWSTFVHGPASELADHVHDGTTHPAFAHLTACSAALASAEGDDWAEYRILCEVLSEQARHPRDEQRIRAVQRAMSDPYLLQIPDFASRAGVSVRTLERVCLKYCGFSPNVILRRQRLIRSLTSYINEGDVRWSEAIDRHYHDQSHFVREFHHFMGMSPSEYGGQDHPIMRAFMENRQQVWGTPVRASDAQQAVAPVEL